MLLTAIEVDSESGPKPGVNPGSWFDWYMDQEFSFRFEWQSAPKPEIIKTSCELLCRQDILDIPKTVHMVLAF